ncbi:MAG: hypothetical protein MUO40_11295, partial [Anaerolineaceae bacterium]|nr:hypothetical protein [Anaerolineaceae bacterium]
KRSETIDRPENPRWIIYDRYIPRGNIYSQNGNLIASTQGQIGSYSRKINYDPLSTVIGYTNPLYGQSNLEESLYPYLRGLEGVPYADVWWNQRLYNQPPLGLDLRLSLNLTQQGIVDVLMDDVKGSAVLMNAKSGEIYVMASHPFYNAETLDQDWQDLIQDKNAPLLNRATQGAYSLGTATTSLLLPAFIDSQDLDLSSLSLKQRVDFSCLNVARGSDSNIKGLQYGCTRSVQELENSISGEKIIKTLESFGIYSSPPIQLPILEPSLAPDLIIDPANYFSSTNSLLVSPLQMALTSSVLTNKGFLPCPRIVNSYQDKTGEWIAFPAICEPNEVLNRNLTDQVIYLLQAESELFWFTIGYASTSTGEPLTWYLGGTLPEWQGTPLAVAIVLEKYDPILAQELGRLLLTQATEY